MQAIVFERTGPAAEVIGLQEVDPGVPAHGQALVRMLYAPINPADLNILEGKYAIRPPLPAVPGVEGLGRVETLGPGCPDDGPQPGDHVLLPHAVGTWRQSVVVDTCHLVVVPKNVDPQQAAMLRVNPATALRMLRDFVDLKAGDWVLQNGSNSAVGRAVIQIAKANGWRTVNLVRRPELVPELLELGADVVLVESDAVREQISEATGNACIPLALNCVGGESALRLANSLGKGGTLVTYGAMSLQALRIPNGLLIFKDVRFRGFWVTQWYEQATAQEREAMFKELFNLAGSGVIHCPVERVYPLAEIRAAVERAREGRRAGKILLDLSK